MKKTRSKLLLAFVLVFVLIALFAVVALAVTPGTGYCMNTDNKQTNIKWTMDASGVLTFEIDRAASDKLQVTALYNKDPLTGSAANYEKCLPTFADAVKIIVGDGITTVTGFASMSKLQQVELASSVTTIGYAAFESCSSLQSVYIRGTDPSNGLFDFSNITSFGNFACDGVGRLTKLKFNPNYAGDIPMEMFKNTSLIEIELPAGVAVIRNGAFTKTQKLAVLTVQGMSTIFESDDVFKNSDTFPAIKAKSGSKAAEFAKANGYTFIDLDSGETIKGTRPTTSASSGDDTPVTPPTELPVFNPDGATAWGHSSGKYGTMTIVNTYWAYYRETKTLEFVSATKAYNETGSISNVDKDYTSWAEYKDEIEHIIVGDFINKISGNSFMNYPALIDVRLGATVDQIDPNAFTGCSSLTTMWRNGQKRIEGRIDLRGLQKVNDVFSGTKITEIVLPNNTKSIGFDLPTSLKTIWVNNITAELIQYAKDNCFNVQNINNPAEIYEFWVFVDPTLPACGTRCVFGFDEVTGTLTVYGAGMISDVDNYYGGGSKNQAWFSIKQQVKHVVITDKITGIGKYAFCEFSNLETVQIPSSENFEILSAAFEKCHKLKSIYLSGTNPVEGTADIRNVHTINSWSFAYDWLIANVVVSSKVTKIGASVFEENINLANIYGTPGSYAETYAAENGKTFYDISVNAPQPIISTPPITESTDTETTNTGTVTPDTTKDPDMTDGVDTDDVPNVEGTDDVVESETWPTFVVIGDEQTPSPTSINHLTIIVVAIVVVVVVAAVIVVLVITKKKKH